MGIWHMGDDAVRCDVVFLLLLLLNAWLWDNVVFPSSSSFFLLHELWAFSQTKGKARPRARAMGDGVFYDGRECIFSSPFSSSYDTFNHVITVPLSATKQDQQKESRGSIYGAQDTWKSNLPSMGINKDDYNVDTKSVHWARKGKKNIFSHFLFSSTTTLSIYS